MYYIYIYIYIYIKLEPTVENLVTSLNIAVWSRKWQPIPVLLPGKSHGQRGLEGSQSMGSQESDTTEQLSRH